MTPIERPIQSESVKFKVGLKLDSWHCSQSTEDFDKSTKLYTVCPQKMHEPLNILQQQLQICSDFNKILRTQDDFCYKHYYVVSYKSALTLLKYEFLNNITHKSLVSIAVDVSQNSQNVQIRCSKCPPFARTQLCSRSRH